MSKKSKKNKAAAPPTDAFRIDRRTALKGLGATALLGVANPGCGPDEPMPPLDFDLLRSRIDTVVMLMMENRSFDHYFGALSLAEGRSEVDGLQAGMSNPHPDGSTVEVYPGEVICLKDPPHSWNTSRAQFNEGANSGFVEQHYQRWGDPELAREVMGYFGRETLSTFYTLADHSVLCDRWFCSQMSSTWPNRFYAMAGQNGGVHGNDMSPKSFPSIMNRLQDAGIPWADYFANVPFAALLGDLPNDGVQHFHTIDQFFLDAQRGQLPNFVWVDPAYGRSDDHPPAHPVAGQIYASLIYEALASSPQWDRTLFVITYDEHGGFHDHVPPPTAADDREGEGYEQLGFRVPTLIAGPWVKPGHVSKVTYDHTSFLAFVERLWDLPPLTARDAAADPMLDVFDHEALANQLPHPPIKLPTIEADEAELYAPECTYLATEDDVPTGQPELEAFFDANLAGSPLDRRAYIDETWDQLLRRAKSRGLLRFNSSEL